TTATGLGTRVGGLLGIGDGRGWSLLVRLLSVVVALVAGTALFRLLFAWFSPVYVPARLAWVGSWLGAAGLLVLQALTGYLIRMFSRNLTAQLFGPIIILMLFLNLFATLILLIAAWLATAVVVKPVPQPVVEQAVPEPVETRPGQLLVSSKVAQKSLGVGLKTGYVVGAATGIGIGAVVVGGLKALFGKRS
ncbi:MAG: YhjD/YihY/BrkB family envelope integrity protein, partial [Propionicimonas sp.]